MPNHDIARAREAHSAGRHQDVIALLSEGGELSGSPAELYLFATALFRVRRYRDSLVCWERLESLPMSAKSRNTVRINLWNTAYMAARSEAENGRYAESHRCLERFCEGNPGFRGDEVFRKIQALSERAAAAAAIAEARERAEAGDFSGAALRLAAVRDSLNEIERRNGERPQ